MVTIFICAVGDFKAVPAQKLPAFLQLRALHRKKNHINLHLGEISHYCSVLPA